MGIKATGMNQLTLTFLVVCLRVNYVQQFTSSRISVILGHGMQADETSDTEAFVRELEQRVPQHGDTFLTSYNKLNRKASRRRFSSVNNAALTVIPS